MTPARFLVLDVNNEPTGLEYDNEADALACADTMAGAHVVPAPIEPWLYLVVIREDVGAELLGPYADDAARLAAAAQIRHAHGDRDGLHRLDVAGPAFIADFSGGEIDRAVAALAGWAP